MDFYTISTLKSLDLHHLGDRYFCLAHFYLQNRDYRNFFLSIRKIFPSAWITLDNGTAEHSLVTEDTLLQIVDELHPNEVISPDILFNKDQTLANLNSFVKKMKQFPNTEIFACPQGENKKAWIDCYVEMLNSSSVSTIGLSKIAIPFAFRGLDNDKGIAESRQEAVQYLFDHDLIQKPLHFLGMGDPREYIYYKKFDKEVRKFFRSSDSCYAILSAVQEISFIDGDFTRVPTYGDFYNHKLSERERDLALKNVAFLKQYNRGV